MNKSIIWIALLIIAIIAIVAWFLNCPMCVFLPLLFMLGAAFLGWLAGLKWLGLKYSQEDRDNDQKEFDHKYSSLTTEWNGKYDILQSDYDGYKSTADNKYNTLDGEFVKYKNDHKAKYTSLTHNYNAYKSEAEGKYKALNADWEAKYKDAP